MSAVLDRVELLACPRNRSPLELRGDTLVCARGTSPDGQRRARAGPSRPGADAARLLGDSRGGRAGSRPGAGANGRLRRSVRHGADRGDARESLPGSRPASQVSDSRVSVTAPRGTRLLDLGCNWGRWSIAAARAGFSVVGVDPSVEAIAAADRVARQLGEDVSYAVGDARRLPFPDATFEVVFSFSVLQHFDPAAFEEAVDEIGRVLVPARPRLRPDGERLRAAEPAQPRARSQAAESVRRPVPPAFGARAVVRPDRRASRLRRRAS